MDLTNTINHIQQKRENDEPEQHQFVPEDSGKQRKTRCIVKKSEKQRKISEEMARKR